MVWIVFKMDICLNVLILIYNFPKTTKGDTQITIQKYFFQHIIQLVL